jgi:hypothetical protein
MATVTLHLDEETLERAKQERRDVERAWKRWLKNVSGNWRGTRSPDNLKR